MFWILKKVINLIFKGNAEEYLLFKILNQESFSDIKLKKENLDIEYLFQNKSESYNINNNSENIKKALLI